MTAHRRPCHHGHQHHQRRQGKQQHTELQRPHLDSSQRVIVLDWECLEAMLTLHPNALIHVWLNEGRRIRERVEDTLVTFTYASGMLLNADESAMFSRYVAAFLALLATSSVGEEVTVTAAVRRYAQALEQQLQWPIREETCHAHHE